MHAQQSTVKSCAHTHLSWSHSPLAQGADAMMLTTSSAACASTPGLLPAADSHRPVSSCATWALPLPQGDVSHTLLSTLTARQA
jgi:hypothetical protein